MRKENPKSEYRNPKQTVKPNEKSNVQIGTKRSNKARFEFPVRLVI